MNYRNDSHLKQNKKEIILDFPLRRKNKNGFKKVIALNSETEVNEKLNRFYKLTERLRNNEWHQEYFLIYNSYVIENT